MPAYNSSPEFLYSEHTSLEGALKEATHTLPEVRLVTSSVKAAIIRALDSGTLNHRQYMNLSNQLAQAHTAELQKRLEARDAAIQTAQEAVDEHLTQATQIYADMKDIWHEQALTEDANRVKS